MGRHRRGRRRDTDGATLTVARSDTDGGKGRH
ncbi:hypothetical protein chiPu_0031156, partial [Chiloscyllium punctatum]|nr:hypothetical protein [Chiloscyllium punctatum]